MTQLTEYDGKATSDSQTWENMTTMGKVDILVKVQFRGPKLYKKMRALFHEESYLPAENL